jgi:hypothetical protein
MIQACTRLSIDLDGSRLLLRRPLLPPFLKQLTFTNLQLPFGSVDLLLEPTGERHDPDAPDDTAPADRAVVTVLRQSSDAFRVEVTT